MALKKTSNEITISGRVDETGPNTFTQSQISLPLDPLNNEVFVVTSAIMDLNPPDALAGVDTTVNAAIATTSQTVMVGINSSQCIAAAEQNIRAAGFVDGGVGFTDMSIDAPQAGMDTIAVIATDDFFVSLQGTANAVAKAVNFRLYGYRAKADAATYAALVQSELLS